MYGESIMNTTNKKAFTLIEMLVVVVIIGILAAIALPQYQKSILKSQFAEMEIATNNWIKELELYYLVNGSYPPDNHINETYSQMNIQYPGCTFGRYDQMTCENFILNPSYWGNTGLVVVARKPWEESDLVYFVWASKSKYPNRKECCGKIDTRYENFCKSISKTGLAVKVNSTQLNQHRNHRCYEL
jgi:prepilin-type N-terminal cleavage/methylation domain-containing protein